MSENYDIDIISPEEVVLSDKVNSVTIPSFEGEMTILSDHIPLITFLRPGIIKISGNKEAQYFVEEGTVEFSENNLLILTSTIKELPNFDKVSLDNLIKDSENKLKNSEASDKEKYILSYKIETLKNIS